jgi:hypothetical protein
MSYARRLGRRPMEQASKVAHSHVISDATVKAFIDRCAQPQSSADIDLGAHRVIELQAVHPNPIKHVVAIDSGFTEVPVSKAFPSSVLGFFQFGALAFSIADLESLEKSAFIDPEDMAKLKHIERLKLTLPIRNIGLRDETLTNSVRIALHEFFKQARDGTSLLDTLKWFLFEEYRGGGVPEYNLANCPICKTSNVAMVRTAVALDGTVPCSHCKKNLYLIDAFRLHEAIDDEIGAGGILGYVTTLLEQIVMAHFIRLVMVQRPALLRELLFIKDGPLAFFGQTANMHKNMRALAKYLFENYALYMAGLEKSGAFVEHAAEVAAILNDGALLILDNDYIYKYIIPGKADPANPYGRTTYYSSKLIFKSRHAGLYVVTVPTVQSLVKPEVKDLPNLAAILTNIEKLHCDMYDDALLPVALVNKLVSLANHPSAKILQRFAVDSLPK